MKRTRSFWSIFGLVILLLLLAPVSLACGGGGAANALMVQNGVKAADFTPLTVVSVVGGKVLISRGGADWVDGQEGMTLKAGDKVKTEAGGSVTITFFDGSTIELKGDTAISLDTLTAKSGSSPKVIKLTQSIGDTTSRVVKLVDPASRYDIETAAGLAAVRGTTMVVQVAADGATRVYNVEGTASLTAKGQEVAIPTGSGSTAKVGEPPTAPQPGLPPGVTTANPDWIVSVKGWQQTALQLNAGDSFRVEYRGGSWSVDYRNFPYVGPEGYAPDVNGKIAQGYQFDRSLPYGFLLAKVGNGATIKVGSTGGPFKADTAGFLFLRINDSDAAMGDNDGAIFVSVRKQ